jgi:DNA-directed RNA polymerase subunit RPC12/RpoP
MKLNKCPECGGKVDEKRMSYVLIGVDLGKFSTLLCAKCGEQFYEDSVLDKIDEAAKKNGLWGLEHRTKLNVLGNSLAVRLSKNQVDFGELKKGEDVVVYPESKNRYIIEVSNFKK